MLDDISLYMTKHVVVESPPESLSQTLIEENVLGDDCCNYFEYWQPGAGYAKREARSVRLRMPNCSASAKIMDDDDGSLVNKPQNLIAKPGDASPCRLTSDVKF